MRIHRISTACMALAATMAMSFGSSGALASGDRNCYAHGGFVGALYHTPQATYSGPLPGGGVAPHGQVTGEDLDGYVGVEIGFGCGFGYRSQGGSIKDAPVERGKGFRADLSYTFRSSADFVGVPPTAPITDPIHTSINSHALMVNAYYDFSNSGPIRPYVGAGIGAARLSLDDVSVVNGNTVTFAGNEQWNFAWQLMAGVGIPLTERMMLDVGYRYVNLGDIGTTATAFQSGVATGTSTLDFDDLTSHEARFGVRISFDSMTR